MDESIIRKDDDFLSSTFDFPRNDIFKAYEKKILAFYYYISIDTLVQKQKKNEFKVPVWFGLVF